MKTDLCMPLIFTWYLSLFLVFDILNCHVFVSDRGLSRNEWITFCRIIINYSSCFLLIVEAIVHLKLNRQLLLNSRGNKARMSFPSFTLSITMTSWIISKIRILSIVFHVLPLNCPVLICMPFILNEIPN